MREATKLIKKEDLRKLVFDKDENKKIYNTNNFKLSINKFEIILNYKNDRIGGRILDCYNNKDFEEAKKILEEKENIVLDFSFEEIKKIKLFLEKMSEKKEILKKCKIKNMKKLFCSVKDFCTEEEDFKFEIKNYKISYYRYEYDLCEDEEYSVVLENQKALDEFCIDFVERLI